MNLKSNPTNEQPDKAEGRRRTSQLALVSIFLLIGALFAAWALQSRTADPLTPGAPTSLGEQVYMNYCAACHGPSGEGTAMIPDAPPLDSSSHAWHHADGELQQTILEGRNGMPAFQEQLSGEQVVAVVRHLQTWWLPEQLEQQQSKSALIPFSE